MTTKAVQVNEASARYSVNVEVKDVPPGYKRTEVGVIPGDWEVHRLGELAFITSGGTPSRSYTQYWDGEIPWISTSEIDFRTIDRAEQFITYLGLSNSAAKLLPPGTLVMAMYGQGKTRGKVGILRIEAATNQACAAITLKKNVSGNFVFHFLSSQYESIRNLSNTGNQENLNSSLVRSISIPLPTDVEEQRAIAEALSDVDGLLGTLEALIAKKQAIKQAAMQQLLTGKTRPPGFNGEWETKRLGEIGAFSKGRGIKRDDVAYDGVPCIRYGELYTRYHNYVTTLVSHVSPAVARTALPIKTGDLLFAGSGETAEEIGSCVAYLGEEEAFAGGDIVVLTPTGQDSMYLGHLMNHPLVSMQKVRFGQGDAVVHISARNLAQVEINLPPVEEQSAIATVLSDMDAEIAALERRRDKTKHIKQGMMQQLLTGRVRLVKPEVAAEQAESESRATKAHSWAINEAVVIAVLAKQFGSEAFPLGRMRYTKLSYLLHRHAEAQAEGYMKKAAGPYNPKTRYGGPENIAVKNGYIREHTNGKFRGFVASGDVAEAESYFEKWYGPEPRQWLEPFRYKKNDELELLATVDMAVEELRAAHKDVSVEGVKDVIRNHPEWQAKLDRPIFSDANTAQAIETCQALFGQAPKSPV